MIKQGLTGKNGKPVCLTSLSPPSRLPRRMSQPHMPPVSKTGACVRIHFML